MSGSLEPTGRNVPSPPPDPVPFPVADHQLKPDRRSHQSYELRSAEEASKLLHRAIELADQDAQQLPGLVDREGLLGQEALIEIARDLDVPLEALAGAVVEARLKAVGEQRSLVDRFVGPSEVWARRLTDESESEVMDRLYSWLERGHGLRPRERQDGVVVARKRGGLVGKISQTVRGVQGVGGLDKAELVEAVVVDLDPESRGSVGLSANISSKRSAAVATGAVVAAGGTIVVSIVTVVTAPIALAALPFAVGAGLATSRMIHGSTVRGMTDAVEETIDGVVTKTDPPGILDGLFKRKPR